MRRSGSRRIPCPVWCWAVVELRVRCYRPRRLRTVRRQAWPLARAARTRLSRVRPRPTSVFARPRRGRRAHGRDRRASGSGPGVVRLRSRQRRATMPRAPHQIRHGSSVPVPGIEHVGIEARVRRRPVPVTSCDTCRPDDAQLFVRPALARAAAEPAGGRAKPPGPRDHGHGPARFRKQEVRVQAAPRPRLHAPPEPSRGATTGSPPAQPPFRVRASDAPRDARTPLGRTTTGRLPPSGREDGTGSRPTPPPPPGPAPGHLVTDATVNRPALPRTWVDEG